MRRSKAGRLVAGVILILPCFGAEPRRGETALFILKSGKEFFGQLVIRDTKNIFLKVEDRITQIKADDLDRVVEREALPAEYARRSKKLADGVDAQCALGAWCRSVGLIEEANKHIAAALKLDPAHAAAREELEQLRVKDTARVPWKPDDSVLLRLEVVERSGRSWKADDALWLRLKNLLVGAKPPFMVLPPDDKKTTPTHILRVETTAEVTAENKFYGEMVLSRTWKGTAALFVLDPTTKAKLFIMKPVSFEENFTAREKRAEDAVRSRAVEKLLVELRSQSGFRLAGDADRKKRTKRRPPPAPE